MVIVSQGQQEQVGGTSLSAPYFGGIVAVADQGLTVAAKGSGSGQVSLNGTTQTLPDLYKASAARGSFTAVEGSTTTARSSFGRGGRTTTTPTGLGAPDAANLIASITGTATTTTTATTTGGTTTTTGTKTTTGGTTTTGGGTTTGTGTTTTGGGTTTGTGGDNHGWGRWGFFGSGGSNWWYDFFSGAFVPGRPRV